MAERQPRPSVGGHDRRPLAVAPERHVQRLRLLLAQRLASGVPGQGRAGQQLPLSRVDQRRRADVGGHEPDHARGRRPGVGHRQRRGRLHGQRHRRQRQRNRDRTLRRHEQRHRHHHHQRRHERPGEPTVRDALVRGHPHQPRDAAVDDDVDRGSVSVEAGRRARQALGWQRPLARRRGQRQRARGDQLRQSAAARLDQRVELRHRQHDAARRHRRQRGRPAPDPGAHHVGRTVRRRLSAGRVLATAQPRPAEDPGPQSPRHRRRLHVRRRPHRRHRGHGLDGAGQRGEPDDQPLDGERLHLRLPPPAPHRHLLRLPALPRSQHPQRHRRQRDDELGALRRHVAQAERPRVADLERHPLHVLRRLPRVHVRHRLRAADGERDAADHRQPARARHRRRRRGGAAVGGVLPAGRHLQLGALRRRLDGRVLHDRGRARGQYALQGRDRAVGLAGDADTAPGGRSERDRQPHLGRDLGQGRSPSSPATRAGRAPTPGSSAPRAPPPRSTPAASATGDPTSLRSPTARAASSPTSRRAAATSSSRSTPPRRRR